MKQYRPRIADGMLRRRLMGVGAVLIQGPKWCGKTTTAEQQAKSVVYMDDPEYMEQNVELASLSPNKLLADATPRLIDEWQLAPQLWDAARFEVDHRDEVLSSPYPRSNYILCHTCRERQYYHCSLLRPICHFFL